MAVTVERVVEVAGQTFADEAGIALADEPALLYQLLMLTTLLSTRISAQIAVAACRELISIGCTTPAGTLDTTWEDRVQALDRARYRRYDDRTAAWIEDGAKAVQERFGGDLRNLSKQAESDVAKATQLLEEFEGIGPVGADIFLREVQAVWPWLRPYVGARAEEVATELGLPHTGAGLAEHAGTDDLSAVTAALLRVHLKPSLLKD